MPHIANKRARENMLEEITREGIFSMGNWNELTSANSAFLRLFGYNSIEEFNTLHRSIFVSEADETLVRTGLSGGERFIDRRILFKTRYNRNFWGLLSCVAGNESCCVGAITDITILVENEHTMRLQANALAKSNMELDRFIYSASHDIRSPISTVMGLVNLINLEKEHDRQMELIGMIGSTMTKLDTFLHQLGTHSKNAHRDIEVSRIILPEIVAEVLKQLSAHDGFREVDVKTDVEIEGEFFSDPERVSYVLFDVLKNALDFRDTMKVKRR